MAEANNFENLFEAALTELTTASQKTEEVVTEGESTVVEVQESVADATETEAVGETEAKVEESEEAADSSADETVKSPIAVTEEDIIVLPDGTEVSVKEATLRQRDYTRKTQALAEERKQLESEKADAAQAVEYVNNLSQRWEENQAEVVSGFVASTEDPTLVLSQVIVELAKAEKLDPKFLETFGITPEVQAKWSSEVKGQTELAEVKARLSKFEQERAAIEETNAQKAQEEALVAEYDRQWQEIAKANNLAGDPNKEIEAKLELLNYALENEVPNLKAAWKALQFEKSQAKPAKAPVKKAEVDAKKAATGAITPKSTGGSIVAGRIASNIEDAAWQAFQELTSRKS
jgi:hypothetical protein